MSKKRQAVVDLIRSWEGKNESDGSFKSIIDVYNSYTGTFPRGVKMKYEWAWCACTWSALPIKLKYTDIMPIEISCEYLINNAKSMGCWQENDAYVGKPGDAVLYDWDDTGKGDATGWADHVGTIIETYEDQGYFVVMEGNYSNSVKKRTLSINGKYIRGFITPKYDDNTLSEPVKESGKSDKTIAMEVITGKWGSGNARKTALENAGYKYETIQALVNQILNVPTTNSSKTQTITKKVTATCAAQKIDRTLAGQYKTTANLYMRNDAGTNKKALCRMPTGTVVNCYGYYSVANGVKWLYIEATVDGVKYTGFSSSVYLKK